jgi:rare lipoprotein A
VAGALAARLASLTLAGLMFAACASPRARPVPAMVGAEERGLASWYGEPHHGRRTASGEVYDMRAMTAAHPTLPFGTWLHVENTRTGQVVRVRVNDRGPFVDGRILDVSYAAAVALGAIGPGTIPVRLRVIRMPAP